MILIKKSFKKLIAFIYILIDLFGHFKYSAPDDGLITRTTKEYSRITILEKDLHRIEKGLSLLNAKKSFGLEPASRIDFFLRKHSQSIDGYYAKRSRMALEARDKWISSGERADGLLTERVSPQLDNSKWELFEQFFKSRRSIRNFVGSAPSRDQIFKAIDWSINTPSVCNRQGWYVWYVTQEHLLKKILSLQNGNAGFSNLNAVLIFGMDRKKYTLGSERNQIWIDGGLFAMSTVWGLHAQGLGTCFLNWATSPRKTQALRNLVGASRNIEFITLCAVGFFEKDTLVAISPRKIPSQYFEHLN